MNFAYRFFNGLVAAIFAGVMGWAIYDHAPEFWATLDATFAAAGAIAILVLALVVGFCTLEARV